MRLHILMSCLLVAACTGTKKEGNFEVRLEAAAKQAIAEQSTCDAWVAEMTELAGEPDDDAHLPDKTTALAVLTQLEKRPPTSAASRQVAGLLSTAPEKVDPARVALATKDVPIGCGLLEALRYFGALLEQGKELGLSAEENERVLSATRAFLKTESEYGGSLYHSAVLMKLLQRMAERGALDATPEQVAALEQKYETTRDALRSHNAGVDPNDYAKLGAAILLESKASNDIRLAAKKLIP